MNELTRRARALAIDSTFEGQSSDLWTARSASSLATLWWTDRMSAPYRSGPSRDLLKVKNPDSPAMRRARAGLW
jgi:hypothetical protein